MKQINQYFTDDEHKALSELKKKLEIKNWHDFIMDAAACLDNKSKKEEA